MSVILELSVVCRLYGQNSAYPISLCRGLEYLLKVKHIILVVPNVAGFLVATLFFVAGWKHCPMSENSITLSQNVRLINIHILVYRYARCECKLWKALWFYIMFEVLYLHQILTDYVSNQYINFYMLTCQM